MSGWDGYSKVGQWTVSVPVWSAAHNWNFERAPDKPVGRWGQGDKPVWSAAAPPWKCELPTWSAAHNWNFERAPDKPRKNVGDEILTWEDPTFDIDHTGEPITNQQKPYGYWWKDLTFTYFGYYTSKPYGILAFDPEEMSDYAIDVAGTFTAGVFRAVIQSYDMGTESLDVSGTFAAGDFKTVMRKYGYEESLDVAGTFTAGVFRQAIHSYEIDTESLDVEGTFRVGRFRDALLNYEEWPEESLDVSGTFTGGAHYVP